MVFNYTYNPNALKVELCFRIKINAHGIDAVALSCSFPGAVVKNMAQMTPAIGADRFGAHHAVGGVPDIFNGTGYGLVKRRPSATTFKLMFAFNNLALHALQW